jgi:uncharacterized protein (DUF488 family)
LKAIRITFAPIHTIGHSTRSLDELVKTLQAYRIQKLIDIRTVPRSAWNPQFNRESLPSALKAAGIEYSHMGALGGLRKARRDSINTAWKNLRFRGYADYMQTAEFAAGIDALLDTARTEAVCIMCAEAVPWRCHRNLVADALFARGIEALHILSVDKAQPHKLTSFAHVEGDRVLYPAETRDLFA